MAETGMVSESDEGEVISDFGEDLEEELKNLPHIMKLVHKMRDRIKRQCKKISKLRNKLNEQKAQRLKDIKAFVDYGTQTDPLQYLDTDVAKNWDLGGNEESKSIVEQVKQVAATAMEQTGFVYEETSGLYYDYNTGYYYDSKQGLYYNGNTGTYYYYDEATQTYKFHSQVEVNVNDATVQQNTQKKEKRKARKANKDDGKKRKQEECSENEEPEEGECSISDNDSSNETSSDLSTSSESDNEDAQDLARTYPPCMRIIVKETNLPVLKVGSLFLVAYTGGSMGREGDHAVLIPDINISKHHARFLYDETKKIYHVVDSGSRNGTFLNGERLSVAKQESDGHEVTHGSIIQVGSTKLLCHIHNGNETCGHCEPGLVQQSLSTDESKTSKKELHKQELKRLKNKFGLEKSNVPSASQVAIGYQDRAQARRQCVGSSTHHVKTQQSSIDTSITKDNRGFKLLSKMGWSEGRSLGKDGDGRTEPIPLSSNHNKAGFGASDADFSKVELDSTTEKKQAMWRKTQQRYKDLPD